MGLRLQPRELRVPESGTFDSALLQPQTAGHFGGATTNHRNPCITGTVSDQRACMVDFVSVKQSIVNNSTGMKSPANWNSFEDKGISSISPRGARAVPNRVLDLNGLLFSSLSALLMTSNVLRETMEGGDTGCPENQREISKG